MKPERSEGFNRQATKSTAPAVALAAPEGD